MDDGAKPSGWRRERRRYLTEQIITYLGNKRALLSFIGKGIAGQPFDSIYNSLKNNDRYMALADFADYQNAQKKASALYGDREKWNKMSLVNIAKSGIFSADRSINDYAENIWHLKPVK